MDIGIIGSGRMAMAIAKKLIHTNVGIILSNSRGPETLQSKANELGSTAIAGTIEDAANADIVILALPWENVPQIIDKIKYLMSGKIVIDVTNPYVNDMPIRLNQPSSSIIAEYFPDSIIVKAFNHLEIPWLSADTDIKKGKRVAFIAGDDESANETVSSLISEMGFQVVDLGNRDQGGILMEPGNSLAGLNLVSYNLNPL